MSSIRPTGKKSGNPVLLYLTGGLFVVLVILIFLGSGRSSGIDQLLAAAAPDSSGFVPDSVQQELVSGEVMAEEPEPEIVQPIRDTVPAVATTSATDSSTPAPVVSPAPTETTPVQVTEGGSVMTYKIRKGDTMYKIAARFGNKPADIMSLNGLSDMSVQADKEIKVKIKALHTVGEGEGLLAIADKYGVPLKSIKAANSLTSEGLSAGLQLIIPLK
jgi:LysM repeat protein